MFKSGEIFHRPNIGVWESSDRKKSTLTKDFEFEKVCEGINLWRRQVSVWESLRGRNLFWPTKVSKFESWKHLLGTKYSAGESLRRSNLSAAKVYSRDDVSLRNIWAEEIFSSRIISKVSTTGKFSCRRNLAADKVCERLKRLKRLTLSLKIVSERINSSVDKLKVRESLNSQNVFGGINLSSEKSFASTKFEFVKFSDRRSSSAAKVLICNKLFISKQIIPEKSFQPGEDLKFENILETEEFQPCTSLSEKVHDGTSSWNLSGRVVIGFGISSWQIFGEFARFP